MGIESVATFAQQRRDKKAQPRAKRAKKIKLVAALPTPEQIERHGVESAGMAVRLKATIKTLFETDRITTAEYVALNYYSEQANAAERSPIKSNLDKTVSSGGDRPISLVCPYKEATERMERQMLFASRTARAICVENYSLSAWAVNVFGGREHKGRIVPRKDWHVAELLTELKAAAKRIVI
jgi:hypothetical protein